MATVSTATCSSPLSLFRSSPSLPPPRCQSFLTIKPLPSSKFILHSNNKSSSTKLLPSCNSSSSSDSNPSVLDSVFVLAASLAISVTLFVSDIYPASAFVVTTPRKLQTDELATVRLFQKNTPSVVYITNLAARLDAFTLDVLVVPQGSGSGFVWDKDGHIVTNYHVIRGASDLRC